MKLRLDWDRINPINTVTSPVATVGHNNFSFLRAADVK